MFVKYSTVNPSNGVILGALDFFNNTGKRATTTAQWRLKIILISFHVAGGGGG